MKRLPLLHAASILFVACFLFLDSGAQTISYPDAWSAEGFSLKSASSRGVGIDFSIHSFSLPDVTIQGQVLKRVSLPGAFLFNEAGAPDLPGYGRYLAIPQGATAALRILSMRSEILNNVEIAPAPVIPKENEDGPLTYFRDPAIFSSNAFYPAEPVLLSPPGQIRGVDVVMLGITPFRYNPVTKELVILRDLKIEITFSGGNGHFGEDRLRSRWWDPILEDAIFNHASLPVIDYDARNQAFTDIPGYEYLIICPNGAVFQQWADSIRRFRIQEGITTVVKTLTDVGGNTTTAIENYINTAYNTWTPPPAAVLLLGDFGTDANASIIAPIWNSYCASDNIYADVNNDDLPEICFARITANNATQLQVMCSKFLNYERNPPTASYFYLHPVTALGWQTERWFQICSETVGGFWKYQQGKDPTRINEVYGGNPSVDPWSTAPNTSTVLSYFGPGGQNYIPATPQQMACCWTGGNATGINNALNAGAFCLMHRDHGGETGWGEPAYNNSNIDGLTNVNKLSFIFSINCLTGKYNWTSECFAEKFHRYTYLGNNAGALGLIAASEVSYSFVNDTYLWGMMDNFWPGFMPTYGTTPASRGFRPCFGNAAGKIFLQQSNWPYNTGNKVVTYHLFHHHGDAFSVVFSEVPQALTVIHNSNIPAGSTSFTVTANTGSLICLSVADQILGTAAGTGSPVVITIPGTLVAGQNMIVTVTKQNYFRYKAVVPVVPPGGPIPDFIADSTEICAGQNVDFTDLSTNSPTSWNWSFPGGIPSASTVQHPQNIVYPASGYYNVSLTVGNGMYFNSVTKLNYIHVAAPAGTPATPSGDTLLCQNNPNTLYTIFPVPNAMSYTWNLTPDTAGILTPMDTAVVVNWSDTYTGYAWLKVQAGNGCGSGPFSPSLPIHLRPFPGVPATPVGPTQMCQGTASAVYTTVSVPFANSYDWTLQPSLAGTIAGDDTVGTVTWDPAFTSIAQVSVRSVNDCNLSAWSNPLDVTIWGIPNVNLGKDTTLEVTQSLLLDAGNPGSSYLWNTGATTQTLLVTFLGNVSDTYWVDVSNNGCLASDTIVISFIDPVGIPPLTGNLTVLIVPNPSRGEFRIKLTGEGKATLDISIRNLLGTNVFTVTDLPFEKQFETTVNLKHLPAGVYTMILSAGDQKLIRKIVLQK